MLGVLQWWRHPGSLPPSVERLHTHRGGTEEDQPDWVYDQGLRQISEEEIAEWLEELKGSIKDLMNRVLSLDIGRGKEADIRRVECNVR